MDNREIRDFMLDHQCMVEDLRVAANLLPKSHSILIDSLKRYADELAEYDVNYCKEYVNPFKK